MRQIAAEVGGVQAGGALYLYTKDKQSLLFDLMRNHMEELLDAWAAEPKGGGPPRPSGWRPLPGSTSVSTLTGPTQCSSPIWNCVTWSRTTSP